MQNLWKKIGEALLARGYPKGLVARTFGTLAFGMRKEMLKPNRGRKVLPQPGCAALRVPYDPAKPPNHIRRLLPQLTESQPIQSMLAFQGSKHTSQKLVRSKVGAPTTKTNTKMTPLPPLITNLVLRRAIPLPHISVDTDVLGANLQVNQTRCAWITSILVRYVHSEMEIRERRVPEKTRFWNLWKKGVPDLMEG